LFAKRVNGFDILIQGVQEKSVSAGGHARDSLGRSWNKFWELQWRFFFDFSWWILPQSFRSI